MKQRLGCSWAAAGVMLQHRKAAGAWGVNWGQSYNLGRVAQILCLFRHLWAVFLA